MADALRRAAGNGDLQRVKALLATGVDVNALCPLYGKTPLHDAAWQGRIECQSARPHASPTFLSRLSAM